MASKKKLPSPFVRTSSAQSYTMCDTPVVQDTNINQKANQIVQDNRECSTLRCLIELQQLNGLRISEVLNIRQQDINSMGSVLIKGLKGSNDRLAYVVHTRDILLSMRSGRAFPFSIYSRFQIYRYYKKVGLYNHYQGLINNSVTHVFRHEHVKRIVTDYSNLDLAQMEIGHKSQNSTKYYTKEARIQ